MRILIVEDNQADARLLEILLREERDFDADLSFASNLEEGLAALARDGADAVLLDMQLPDSQGMGTLTAMHEANPETPILLLTGMDDIRAAARALRLGAQDYLVKGAVSGPLLTRAIRYAIDRGAAELQIKQLSRRVLEIQEDERSRISREIHDGLGQDLFAMKLQVQTAFQRFAPNQPDANKARDQILEALSLMIENARRLARSLSPAFMESAGLPAAIQRLGETFEMGGSMRVSVEVDALDGFFPGNWDINLYRIVHEALLNAARHSGAHVIGVGAASDGDRLRVRVHDNGKGFDPEAVRGGMHGLGLAIMEARAHLMSAKLTIRSVPGDGSEVILDIPRRELER
ncbi:MAG: response regulator [Leptospirales bacterium]|nr:response regulator [Leptospirales bacterium]